MAGDDKGTGDKSIPDEPRVIQQLRRCMALFTGLLVWSTWPLWTGASEFPTIPWIGADWSVPLSLNALFLTALAGLMVLQFAPLPDRWRGTSRLQAALFAVTLLLLPGDQHRLQPWVWQMIVAAAIIGLSNRPRQTVICLRWLTVSIYFWSALSKIDWAFLEGRGQWLLQGLAEALGLPFEMWSERTRLVLTATFPLGEFALAGALAWPRARRVGLWMSIGMHVMLLAALGPLGHDQYPAVLVWNVFFVVQNVLLFGRHSETGDSILAIGTSPPRTRIAQGLTIAVCLLPALSPWGFWDHWPSWAVYSERPGLVQMSVAASDVARLPPSLRPFVGPAEPLSEWRPVNLDAWSFASCRCPIYPQRRFRIAVINILVEKCGIPARITVWSPPNRWTGKREESDEIIERP